MAGLGYREVMFEKKDFEKGLEIHRKSVVIDTLGLGGPRGFSKRMMTEVSRLLNVGMSGYQIWGLLNRIRSEEIVKDEEYRSYFIGEWRDSGVTAQSHTIGTFDDKMPIDMAWSYKGAVKGISNAIYLFDSAPEFIKVTKAEHVKRAKKEGRFGIILNFQNTDHLEKDLDNLESFYLYGVRIIQLTYNSRNYVGDGCTERTDAGLSEFGIQLVERMNRLGMLIDLSHCGYSTAADAVQYSKQPVAFTHTFAWSLSKHDRGKKDDQLKAVAEKGGYIGVLIVPTFITDRPKATLDDFLNHVDYIVKLVGVDHVGVGTDFNGAVPHSGLARKMNEESGVLGFRRNHRIDWNAFPEGFEDYSNWPKITAGLVSRGYGDDDIEKIIGRNFLRLFERVVG